MATTPTYSWPIPDDTDLVKDGAEAIRDLGNAIDTTVDGLPGAGLVHINTTSFSAVTAHSIPDDSFTTTYDNYRIVFFNLQNTSTGTISMRMRASGSDNATTNYAKGGYFAGITTAVTRITTSGQTSVSTGATITAGNRAPLILDLTNPRLASLPTLGFWQTFTTSAGDLYTAFFQYGSAAAFDSMSFITSAGTMTGEVSVYGYRKS
jgi:hypothetical protein